MGRLKSKFYSFLATKGQIKQKADWHAIDSPPKRTNKFVLFAFFLFTANKTNSSVCFLEESMVRQSAFGYIWPLALAQPLLLSEQNRRYHRIFQSLWQYCVKLFGKCREKKNILRLLTCRWRKVRCSSVFRVISTWYLSFFGYRPFFWLLWDYQAYLGSYK